MGLQPNLEMRETKLCNLTRMPTRTVQLLQGWHRIADVRIHFLGQDITPHLPKNLYSNSK